MKITEKKQVEQEIIVDVRCDLCGKSCKKVIGTTEEKENVYTFEYAVLDYNWGFGTRHDEEHGKLDICEDCWERIINEKGCKVRCNE